MKRIDMKQKLVRLFRETLEDSSLARVMASKVSLRGDSLVAGDAAVDIGSPERILVAGIGKAAGPMCLSLMPLLPASKTSVVVVAPDLPSDLPSGFRAFAGGHPYPNEQSALAARHLLDSAAGLGHEDLFLCLLSGGGSAICEAPLDPRVTLAELRTFNEVLVTCGANIVEMNILRKHIKYFLLLP